MRRSTAPSLPAIITSETVSATFPLLVIAIPRLRLLFSIIMKHLLPTVLALVLALSFSSCSTRFNHDWKKAATATETTAPKDVTGAWQGTWKSEATGHHGTLKAVVSKLDGKNNAYAFHYHATWRHFLSATFNAEHTIKWQGKNYVLTGQHHLGSLFGGIYHYDGTATSAMFKCHYRCDLDHGTFEMQRP